MNPSTSLAALAALATGAFLGFTGAHAGSISFNGTLTNQGSTTSCNYTAMSETTAGSWTVNCNAAGTKSITVTPQFCGSVCTAYSGLTQSTAGNWVVSGCVAASGPTISLTSPAAATTILEGTSFLLQATVACSTSISNVTFKANGTAIPGAVVTTPPYQFNWTPAFGTYDVTATATDSAGLASTSNPPVQLKVNRPPTSVTIVAAPPTTRAAPATFSFTGSASDPDGVAKIEYRTTGGTLLGQSSAAPNYAAQWANVGAGSYSVIARAYDSLGAAADSAPITVTVTVGNNPPTVSIAQPGEGTTVTSVVLTATVSDSDGGVTQVEYVDADNNNASIGTSTAGPDFRVTWNNVSAGMHHVVARATDNSGGVGISPARTFSYGNYPPGLAMLSDWEQAPQGFTGSNIPIVVRASDNEGAALTVTYFNVTSSVNLGAGFASGGNTYTYNWTPPPGAQGVFDIRVTANDGVNSVSIDVPVVVATRPAASAGLPDVPTTATVGTTPGTFAVADNGAATYSVPIAVPPGPLGMQPSLSLNYNSQGGPSAVGVGWSLGGASSITRCGATVATEGRKEGINYDNDRGNDLYCLDGQKLIPIAVSQPNGSANCSIGPVTKYKTEYRTEVESYARIIAYEDDPCVVVGPSRFEVETKSGQWLLFGLAANVCLDPNNCGGAFGDLQLNPINDANGTWVVSNPQSVGQPGRLNVVKAWPLSRALDRDGNYIRYTYCGINLFPNPSQCNDPASSQTNVVGSPGAFPPTEHHLKTIRYGGRTTRAQGFNYQAPTARVDFVYARRNGADEYRVFDSGGGETTLTWYLQSITTSADNQYALSYYLNYSITPNTARLRLDSIKQCTGSSQAECLTPTTFSHLPGAGGAFQAGIDAGIAISGNPSDLNAVGDIDGDGKSDLIYLPDGSSQVQVRLSSNGFALQTLDLGLGNAVSRGADRYLADVNGDGKADLILRGTDGNYRICDLRQPGGLPFCQVSPVQGDSSTFYLQGDFDGDGRIDFLIFRGQVGSDFQWDLHLGRNDLTLSPKQMITAQLPNPVDPNTALLGQQYAVGDFNGDGRADVIFRKSASHCTVPLEPPDGFQCPNGATTWNICFSRPGPAGTVVFDCRGEVTAGNGMLDKSITVDFNGDGLADLAYPSYPDGNAPAGQETMWNICLSAGDGSFQRSPDPPIQNGNYTPQSLCKTLPVFQANVDEVVFGDFDGDGRTDMARHISGTTWRVCFSRTLAIANNANNLTFDCRDWQGGMNPIGNVAGNILSGDFNGDGKTDILAYRNATLQMALSPPGVPDLLIGVQNGLGATTSIDYLPLTNSTVYSRGNPSVGANELVIQSPMYVVRKTYESAGIGAATFDHTYQYSGLKGSINGRGLLGFVTRTISDSNQLTRITRYNQDVANWWKAGRPDRVQTYSPTMALLSDVKTDWRIAGQVYPNIFPVQLAQTVEARNDLDGSALPCKRTSLYDPVTDPSPQVDSNGNVLKSVIETASSCSIDGGSFNADGYRQVTTNTYLSNTDNWILDRTSRTSVTYTSPVAPNVTRTSAFGYQGFNDSCAGAVTGKLCSTIIEPDDPTTSDARHTTQHQYDSWGNITATTQSFYANFLDIITGVQSRTTRTTFTGGRFPQRVTNAAGHFEDRTYDSRFGVIRSVTNYIGGTTEPSKALVTTSLIDNFGRKVGERTRAFADNATLSETKVDWAVDSLAGTEAVYSVTTTAHTGAQTKIYFDRLQREVSRASRAFNNNLFATVSTDYDNLGHKHSITRPSGSGTVTTTYGYDALDRPTTEAMSGSGLSSTTTTSYHGLSTVVVRTNTGAPDRKAITLSNSQGQVVSVSECLRSGGYPGPETGSTSCMSGSSTVTTTYAYDATSNTTSVTTPATPTNPTGLVRTAQFDKRGRKYASNDPDIGPSTFIYNGAGELSSQAYTPNAATGEVKIGMDHDSLGRMIGRIVKTAQGSQHAVLFTYDTCDENATRTNGALCAVASKDLGSPPAGLTSFDADRRTYFDAYGRSYQEVVGRGGYLDYAITVFDAQGRPQQVVHRGFQGLNYAYTAWAGDLASVTDYRDSSPYWQASSRYLDGQIQSMSVGSTSISRGYDGFGRTTSINAGALQSASYSFDALGNLLSRQDSANGLALQTFTYDTLNRVLTGGTNVTYDDAGNIATRDGNTYAYFPGTNRIQDSGGGRKYGYDLVGNATSSAGRTITWTTFNMPKSITSPTQSLSWSYDEGLGKGMEVSSVTGSTYYFPGLERIISPDGTVRNRMYVGTPEGVVAANDVIVQTGGATSIEKRYWLKDHLGSVVATIDGATGLKTSFGFGVWGERTGTPPPLNSATTQQGFTGHEMLDEVGFVHMNGRVYDPAIGKFLSADPFVQAPMNGQSFNRYSYVMNNPLAATDPTGYASFWAQWRRPVAAIAAAATMQWEIMPAVLGELGVVGEAADTLTVMASGFAAGGISGGNVQSAVQGAIFAMANYGVGEITGHASDINNMDMYFSNVALHGLVGCGQQMAAGGSCRAGALAGGFSALAQGIPRVNKTGIAGRVAIGALASRLSGDKAQNGAITAAFDYLFNDEWAGEKLDRRRWPEYHEYGYESRIRSIMCEDCSEASAWFIAKSVQMPSPDRTPMFSGQVNTLPVFGPTRADIDEANKILYNSTMPGHLLHPGFVERPLTHEGNTYYLETRSRGLGWMGSLNAVLARPFWGLNDFRAYPKLQ